MKPKRVGSPLVLKSTVNHIYYEPKGCVLIIAPWNYPFQLSLGPLVAAVAAGNSVILKPSELTPHTSSLISKLITQIFERAHVAVALGGIKESEVLLEFPFDHIFFTGSTHVGKNVMAAASRNLSSVTLELGGKSPVYVDDSIDPDETARIIAWAKLLNAGQTCVAPDYLVVHKNVVGPLLERLKYYFEESKSLANIISPNHTARLKDLIKECEIPPIVFSKSPKLNSMDPRDDDLSQKKFAPTIVLNPPHSGRLMNEEIFGPILPILVCENEVDFIKLVNEKPKPLSLYIFTDNSKISERIILETSSGGVCVNAAVLHLGNHYLPFGGIGPSGMGNYHGIYGFLTFSNQKAVLKNIKFLRRFMQLLYPPYTPLKMWILKKLID